MRNVGGCVDKFIHRMCARSRGEEIQRRGLLVPAGLSKVHHKPPVGWVFRYWWRLSLLYLFIYFLGQGVYRQISPYLLLRLTSVYFDRVLE